MKCKTHPLAGVLNYFVSDISRSLVQSSMVKAQHMICRLSESRDLEPVKLPANLFNI